MCLARVPFEMASHVRVLGHVLGCAKPVGNTDLCNMAKLHARVLGHKAVYYDRVSHMVESHARVLCPYG
ncbi:Giant hemoglobins B chain [Gossypium arboreum]|uniref:Giant hemoglobins B chain n=1 Tax=Gossypium arboreum TaxID=29729 RepID=A0A0B0MWK2_GOSAR|nr:Giant hemoglobins B chain [Gossypium arboreum]